MNGIERFEASAWPPSLGDADRLRAVETLEDGRILLFANLCFAIEPAEARFLAPGWSGATKNISYEFARRELKGTAAAGADATALADLMSRYAQAAKALVEAAIPAYRGRLELARTSFRPAAVEGREQSPRQDDRRLHIDAFPSRPTAGRRILRVFSNIDPDGRARRWHIGSPFESVARRFLGRLPPPLPGAAVALAALGLTKGRRRPYDHYMLRLHDAMKLDAAYQAEERIEALAFPAGATWMLFTDQVPHAALGGQNALEQTLHLDPAHMKHPERSPLRVLEGLLGRGLA